MDLLGDSTFGLSADDDDRRLFETTSADAAVDAVSLNLTELLMVDDGVAPGRHVFDAVDRYVTPIWYILGIPGNIVAYIVWMQRRMRPSSGCYLAALALDECIFLILQVGTSRSL